MDELDQIKQLAGVTQNVGKLQEYKGPGSVQTTAYNEFPNLSQALCLLPGP